MSLRHKVPFRTGELPLDKLGLEIFMYVGLVSAESESESELFYFVSIQHTETVMYIKKDILT